MKKWNCPKITAAVEEYVAIIPPKWGELKRIAMERGVDASSIVSRMRLRGHLPRFPRKK